MSHHHHGHHHGGHDEEHAEAHNHVHDHDDDITPALQNLLYEQVDFSKLHTLNEEDSNSGRAICQKTWAQRMDTEPELKSSTDEQLLVIVPFTGQVRLHSILVRTSPTESSPKTLKVFLNPPSNSLDFETASEKEPTQTLSISQTSEVQELPVKRAYFNTTTCLALFFEDNWSGGDEDVTRISYLAFKGDFMKLNKEPVSFLYEAAANPSDHTMVAGIGQGVGRSIQ
ncbi:PITH domain-domain-containing protein [Clohesyomyces aquaticus]|uniref:PITH domain-domain-containing protein n=1 Tax=Clohesyomyces aquaticus TaxID=1231657 RepID=A0A1Y2A9P8_9PLEO|nr:PITH domain-domain-containing protein [Clohesyomyces aquaticus]